MLLTIDIGNTNSVIGCYNEDTLHFMSRIATDRFKTADEYAVLIGAIVAMYHVNKSDIDGVIISSVVPPLLDCLKESIKKTFHIDAMSVEPGIKTGLNIKIDNPAQLGTDLVCVSVAALNAYPCPSLVIDMGTATTFSVIDANHCFIGGSILPGIKLSLEALSTKTAQLPQISLEGPNSIIGSNTIDCMKSGVVYGTACMIDGMIACYKEVLGDSLCVIATGGLAKQIITHCKETIIYDENLLLDGLKIIYTKNKPK